MFTRLEQVRKRTRQTMNYGLLVPDIRSKMGRYCFSYRGSKCWMDLDNQTRSIAKLASFKSELIRLICRDLNHPT